MENKRLRMKKLVQQEYETQHFGFSSDTIIDVVRGVIADNVKFATESMSSKIIEHMKCKPEEVKVAEDLLLKEYEAATEKSLQTWESVIEDHFRIPSHVLLEEDEPQRQQFSAAEAAAIDDELASLVARAKRAALLDSLFSVQQEALCKVVRRLQACEQRLGDEQAVHDLEHGADKLVQCAQVFSNKASILREADLRRVRTKETASVLVPRFQHLK